MSCGRKYILELDAGNIRFEIFQQDGGTIPTWLPFEQSTCSGLYGYLRRDRDFICNMNFAHGDYGTHIIWDDLEGLSVHLLLPREEWQAFLYIARLVPEEESAKVDWLKEGF